MRSEPLVEIRDLTVEFPRTDARADGPEAAVRDAGLVVDAGSFTAIVGQTGSGKTLTALSIGRLAPPEAKISGSVLWHGDGGPADLLRLSEEELRNYRGRRIAYIYQDPSTSLNPLIRSGEQIAEAYTAHFKAGKEALRARVFEFLQAVQIKDPERVYASYPHELSGGMKQRVAIAMALIAEPKFLIADEPTTALDATIETEILQLVMRLRKERSLTVLLITHDLNLAAASADTIYVMEKGRVVERLENAGGALDPVEAYTKRLFAASLRNSEPKTMIQI